MQKKSAFLGFVYAELRWMVLFASVEYAAAGAHCEIWYNVGT